MSARCALGEAGADVGLVEEVEGLVDLRFAICNLRLVGGGGAGEEGLVEDFGRAGGGEVEAEAGLDVEGLVNIFPGFLKCRLAEPALEDDG